MPGVSNVNVTCWPGSMTFGSGGSPPSWSWTLWVKLSAFVHVTVDLLGYRSGSLNEALRLLGGQAATPGR